MRVVLGMSKTMVTQNVSFLTESPLSSWYPVISRGVKDPWSQVYLLFWLAGAVLFSSIVCLSFHTDEWGGWEEM